MGQTPFMKAARGGNPEIVRLLMDKGAIVEAKDFVADHFYHFSARTNYINRLI